MVDPLFFRFILYSYCIPFEEPLNQNTQSIQEISHA